MKPLDICIDFDGTCVAHDFPRVGADIGAVPVLLELVAAGHRLILFTMRSDFFAKKITTTLPEIHTEPGAYLTDALNWFKQHNIPLYGVQTNPDQHTWTTSPKAYGHLHIDDAALGCPLLFNVGVSVRPYVDWIKVRSLLVERGILPEKSPACVSGLMANH